MSPDESSDVRSLLVLGSEDEIDYDFERGLSEHLGTIGALPVPPHAGLPGAAAAKATTGISSKAVLLLIGAPIAAASAVIGVWFAAVSRDPPLAEAVGVPEAPAKMEGTMGAEPPSLLGAEGGRAERETDAPPRPTARPSRAAPRAPDRSAQASPVPPVRLSEGAHVASPVEDRNAVPEGEPNRGRPAVAVVPAADGAEEQASEEAARKRAASAAEARRRTDERLEREMAGLIAAKRALADDPGRALLLARQGERDFSHGVFSEERQHILILALIQLGRLDEARRTAAPYLERHPDSPFARRVRAALETATRSAH